MDIELEKMKLKEQKLIQKEREQLIYKEEKKRKWEEKISKNFKKELLIRIVYY